MKNEIIDIIKNINLKIITKVSLRYNIDPLLVASIVWVESRGDTCAARYENNFLYIYEPERNARESNITVETERIFQKCSLGQMQVMGGVCRELGLVGPLTQMFIPKIGLNFGCMKLKELFKKYLNEDEVIASYNFGSPYRVAFDKFTNQDYVDKVKYTYKILKSLEDGKK